MVQSDVLAMNAWLSCQPLSCMSRTELDMDTNALKGKNIRLSIFFQMIVAYPGRPCQHAILRAAKPSMMLHVFQRISFAQQ